MKFITAIFFVFLNLSCYSQKLIDTVQSSFSLSKNWIPLYVKLDNQMGLPNIFKTKDSLHFRFKYNNTILDIGVDKGGETTGAFYHYIVKSGKDYRTYKVVYKKHAINKDTVLLILDSLNKSGIPHFYTQNKLPHHVFIMLPPILAYTFEFSTAFLYTNIYYGDPANDLKVKENKAVAEFASFIDKILELKNNFIIFKNSLSEGYYEIGGVLSSREAVIAHKFPIE